MYNVEEKPFAFMCELWKSYGVSLTKSGPSLFLYRQGRSGAREMRELKCLVIHPLDKQMTALCHQTCEASEHGLH
jgi:hypothetical protein